MKVNEKIIKMNGYLEAMAFLNLRPNHKYTFEFIWFDGNKLNEPSNLEYLADWCYEIRKVLLSWFFEVCEEYDMPEIPIKFQEPCVERFLVLIEDFLETNPLEFIARYMDQFYQVSLDMKNIYL
ncbi:hypothetical protein NSU08_23485 [Paenibacillus sp. FSL H7-0331]|uniref:hypothetical protein n=1 Tax=Paenibacillus sp. FSL H7-0331 TaxID=1920421 RepID=UPI0030F74377